MTDEPTLDEATLRYGTESHYEDAAYYDRSYRRRRDDVRFYRDTVGSLLGERRGRILELGVGTGRVALPLAREGIQVVGVDPMEPMLARFRERLAREPRRVRDAVTLERADVRRLSLDETFAIVTAPFHVFNHLYTRRDVERALRTVRKHLRRRGHFVFDVRNPDPAELARNPQRVYKGRPVTIDGRRYHYRERFDYDPASQVQTIEMAFVGVEDPSDFRLQVLTHRCFYPAELEVLLHYNGLRITERYGDFDREPLDAMSDSQVYVCRPKA